MFIFNPQAAVHVSVTVLEASTLFVTRQQDSAHVRPIQLDVSVIPVCLASMVWLPITLMDAFSAIVQTKRQTARVTQDGSFHRLQQTFQYFMTTPKLMDGLLITVLAS